jgi:hypothetical protein
MAAVVFVLFALLFREGRAKEEEDLIVSATD